MRVGIDSSLFKEYLYIGERASIFGSSQKVNVKKNLSPLARRVSSKYFFTHYSLKRYISSRGIFHV